MGYKFVAVVFGFVVLQSVGREKMDGTCPKNTSCVKSKSYNLLLKSSGNKPLGEDGWNLP